MNYYVKNAILTHFQTFYSPAEGFAIEELKAAKESPYIEELSVYKNTKGEVPYWHYIGLGLSELYDKESDFDEVSGFGIELTFKLQCGNEKTPPVWVKHFLENLAKYVFESGESFNEYDCLDAKGVICQDVPTKLTALAFVQDQLLGNIDTQNGSLVFLQVIGLTNKELEIFSGDNYQQWLQKFLQQYPNGVTDLARNEISL
jgi:suppressor of fused